MAKQLLKEIPNNVPQQPSGQFQGEFQTDVVMVEVDGKMITMTDFMEMKQNSSIKLQEIGTGKYKTLAKLLG